MESILNVREMISDDIDALILMGRRAHEESEYRGLTYDVGKCEMVAQAILHNDKGCCFVALQDGEIAGFMMGEVHPTYFSQDLVASDLLVYVSPEHRGSSAFIRLVMAYMDWATVKRAKIIFLANTTGYKPDMVGKMYERLGFARVGGIYRREV